ncbi:MAG: glycosyltransferase family 10 [Parvularculales bacterium]
MLNVKLISKNGIDTAPLPGGMPQWDSVCFLLDPQARNYDWLVVVDDLPFNINHKWRLGREHLACPQEHTILLTYEPSAVKLYSAGYAAQFGLVLTSHEPDALPHPNRIDMPPMGSWLYRGTHDELCAAPTPPVKTRTISTLCSNKQMRHTWHNLRFHFTRRLQEALPEMDVYGRGINPIDEKVDAIDPYRYHIAIENHIAPYHWTEKLADAFLGCTLPFYAGCPNAADFFPEASFIPIDITDFNGTLSTIRQVIDNNGYEKRLPAILEARRRLLEEQNLFAMLAKIITKRHDNQASLSSRNASTRSGNIIYGRRMIRMLNIPDTIRTFRTLYRRRQKQKKMSKLSYKAGQ